MYMKVMQSYPEGPLFLVLCVAGGFFSLPANINHYLELFSLDRACIIKDPDQAKKLNTFKYIFISGSRTSHSSLSLSLKIFSICFSHLKFSPFLFPPLFLAIPFVSKLSYEIFMTFIASQGRVLQAMEPISP